jgi:hypothetical protein
MYFNDWEKHKDAKINPGLLWEYDINKVDWQFMRGLIVERVIERGGKEDYYAMFNLYGGFNGVKQIIIHDVYFLNSADLAYVETLFNLNRKNLKCYKRQQLRKKFLASPMFAFVKIVL